MDNWCYNCGNPISNDSEFCSDKCKLELEKEREQERIEAEKELAKDNAILDELKSILSTEDYDELISMLEDSENNNFTITNIPIATIYNEKVFNNKYKEYVNQHADGESGDCWYGNVSIELPNKKYFNYDYRC